MRQEKNTFWRETMWLRIVALSLFIFALDPCHVTAKE